MVEAQRCQGACLRSHSKCSHPRDQFPAKSRVSFRGQLSADAWGAFSVMGALVYSDHLALPFSKPQEISSGPAAASLPQPHCGHGSHST